MLQSKSVKVLLSILKPQVNSSSDFSSFFGVITYNFLCNSCIFSCITLERSLKCKVPAKKVQKNDLSWQWKKIQTKITWRIWWSLTRAVESLKIFTLIGYFCRKKIQFELKRYRGVVSWKMTYSFKNDISNLVNFHTSNWK